MAVELSQYHSSESVISDDNHDNNDAFIMYLSTSAEVQFDSSRELAVVSTRYFHEDQASLDTGVLSITSVDQANGTGLNLKEKSQPIELTPMIPLQVGLQVPEEYLTLSEDEEKHG